jgi:hypothetical protein
MSLGYRRLHSANPESIRGWHRRPTILTANRRRVREDVRFEEERLNPGRAERWNSSKLGNEIGRTDGRGLYRMLIAASRNQRNCTTMLGTARIRVDPLVQLR